MHLLYISLFFSKDLLSSIYSRSRTTNISENLMHLTQYIRKSKRIYCSLLYIHYFIEQYFIAEDDAMTLKRSK